MSYDANARFSVIRDKYTPESVDAFFAKVKESIPVYLNRAKALVDGNAGQKTPFYALKLRKLACEFFDVESFEDLLTSDGKHFLAIQVEINSNRNKHRQKALRGPECFQSVAKPLHLAMKKAKFHDVAIEQHPKGGFVIRYEAATKGTKFTKAAIIDADGIHDLVEGDRAGISLPE